MDGFNAIPVFVAVVESGGFSSAARKLNISKSAVSKRITQLEDKLGVRLLYRTTRQLSLTEAGEHYYENAVKALAYANEAEDSVTQQQATPQGRLRINVPMSFGRLHIAPLIPPFLERYPNIHIDMVMDDRVVDLVESGFDLAIRGGDLSDSSLISRKLMPLRLVLCASPDYFAQHNMPQTPADLIDHNCLLFSYSVSQWDFTKQGKIERVRVSGNYQANNSEALREALLQGTGITRIPTFVVRSDIAAGRLNVVLGEYQMPIKAFYALFPKRQHLPAKVRVFIDYIVECLGMDT
ncbi:MAG: LysR family transcriptional regulator [Gammaproteobacteria bacterium]|nr:LysR family transcriptional regulator [Gammaproteobacteria bacterium]